MTAVLYRRLLMKAADVFGGTEPLRRRLGAETKQMSRWLTGVDPVPAAILRKVVDLLAAEEEAKSKAAPHPRPRASAASDATVPH